MRILFTFVGSEGHFEPLAAVAGAALELGHSVAFGCAPAVLPLVEAAGFSAFAMGVDSGRPANRIPLRSVDRDREARDLRERFAKRAARYRLPLALTLCRDWQPDVLVCDETDFGAQIAAEKLGLPYAGMQVIAAGSFVRPEVVSGALDELRAERGLPADPRLERPSQFLLLSPFPPSYRDLADPLPKTAHALRPSCFPTAERLSPPWSSPRPDAPTLYFTLGTIFNLESGDLVSRVVAGLRELDVNLIVTVGRGIDPAELGPQPAHVHVDRYIPQARVLPHCDGVVSHAGSGSVVAALAHGLPQLLIPLGADQPQNADRCAELGVARVLDAVELTPRSVRAAAVDVLEEPSYRLAAERMRDEIAALPDVSSAVALLERLVAERRPIYSA